MVDTDLPIIVSNYRVLLCDEGLPILFTGTNRYGTFVIGSSVDENYAVGVERYFHILVEAAEYIQFERRKVTYLDLLRRAKPVFVMDKVIDEVGAYKIFQMSFEEIPGDYRPSEATFYPLSAHEPTYTYSTSLLGGLADTNHAVPEEVSETQNSIAEAIDAAFNTLGRFFGIKHETLLKPALAGSFKINYEVRLKDFPSLFHSEAEYLQYLNEFLQYCLDDLPAESNQLANLQVEGLEGFNNLIRRLSSIDDAAGLDPDRDAEIRGSVIHDLTTTARALHSAAKVVGKNKNYSGIAVSNVSATDERPLGVINDEYQKQIKDAASVLNESVLIRKSEALDKEVKDYIVHVYDFNKNNGTGWGYVREPDDEAAITAKIAVTPYQPISPSPFTTSLDQNKLIKVRGVLTKGANNQSKLDIKDETVK